MRTDGTTAGLSLPTGITIDSTRVMRFAVLGRNVVGVNAGSRGLFIDPDQNVYPMCLQPPMGPPILASGGAGALTGTYRAAYSFKVKDADGNLLSESPLSPTSAQQTLTAQKLQADFEKSPDSVTTHRAFYRTLTNGSTLLPWFDVDGNTTTRFADDTLDAALATLEAPTQLGAPPGTLPGSRLTLVTEYKGRLWGVGDVDIDDLRFSGAGILYGWPDDYRLPLAPLGNDIYGITGLLRRRDELGVAKRGVLWKIAGDDPDSFEPIKVIDGKGCFAPDSVIVIRDTAYFLGEDGIYTWGPDGVDCVSDKKARAWFASDTYFNRAQYPNAFGKYNPRYHRYELHLAAAGSTDIDRWIEYDLGSGNFFGPHKTGAFTPTFAGTIVDSNNLTVPVMLSSGGHVYTQNRTAFRDDTTAIAGDLISKRHSGDTPDIRKLFQRLAAIIKKQSATGNLQIKASAGTIDQSVTKTYTLDQTLGRQVLDVIGPGEHVQLQFLESTDDLGCEIYGYEIPFYELGQR